MSLGSVKRRTIPQPIRLTRIAPTTSGPARAGRVQGRAFDRGAFLAAGLLLLDGVFGVEAGEQWCGIGLDHPGDRADMAAGVEVPAAAGEVVGLHGDEQPGSDPGGGAQLLDRHVGPFAGRRELAADAHVPTILSIARRISADRRHRHADNRIVDIKSTALVRRGHGRSQSCSLTGHLASASMCSACTTSPFDGRAVNPNGTASEEPVSRRFASVVLRVELGIAPSTGPGSSK